jgi:hypothetical protein
LFKKYSAVFILLPILPMKQLLTILLLSLSTVFAANKPNIIYILADDLGWAGVGWHGSELLKMDSIGLNWT